MSFRLAPSVVTVRDYAHTDCTTSSTYSNPGRERLSCGDESHN